MLAITTRPWRIWLPRSQAARSVLLLFSALLLCPWPAAGGDVQVNTYTSANQSQPSVSMDADGNFVVIWYSYLSEGPDFPHSIHGQRYASDGTAIGGQFQVNTYTTSVQWAPSVSVGSDGDFVVVWHSNGSGGNDSSDRSIQGQRYASDGTAIGGQFQVNTYTTDWQTVPSVSLDSDGDFVVVWGSNGSGGNDSSNSSIQGQRYASDGTAIGGQFQVNTYTPSSQFQPSVSLDSDGDFVVVWSGYADSSEFTVLGQRYASDGTATGGEFQVNTYTTRSQQQPSVSLDSDGDFVVVWTSRGSGGSDSSSLSIQGQRYASDGIALGGQFQVNTYTTDIQYGPSVSLGSDGDFVVVWTSRGSGESDSSSLSIQGQRYASDGIALGGQFQVNTYTTDAQETPSVSLGSDGDFVVVWTSEGSGGNDSSGASIQRSPTLSIFQDPTEIFADGFEEGDVCDWGGACAR